MEGEGEEGKEREGKEGRTVPPRSSNRDVFNSLSVADVEIERVHVFKLLGVHVNRSLKWNDHVRTM